MESSGLNFIPPSHPFQYCIEFLLRPEIQQENSGANAYAIFKSYYPTTPCVFQLLETLEAHQVLFTESKKFLYFELLYECLSDQRLLSQHQVATFPLTRLLINILSKDILTQTLVSSQHSYHLSYPVPHNCRKALIKMLNQAMCVLLKLSIATEENLSNLIKPISYYNNAITFIALEILKSPAQFSLTNFFEYEDLLCALGTSLENLFQLNNLPYQEHIPYNPGSSSSPAHLSLINLILDSVIYYPEFSLNGSIITNILLKNLQNHLIRWAEKLLRTIETQRFFIQHLAKIEFFLKKYSYLHGPSAMSVFKITQNSWQSLEKYIPQETHNSSECWESLFYCFIEEFHNQDIILPLPFVLHFFMTAAVHYHIKIFEKMPSFSGHILTKLYDKDLSNVAQCTDFFNTQLKIERVTPELASVMKKILRIYIESAAISSLMNNTPKDTSEQSMTLYTRLCEAELLFLSNSSMFSEAQLPEETLMILPENECLSLTTHGMIRDLVLQATAALVFDIKSLRQQLISLSPKEWSTTLLSIILPNKSKGIKKKFYAELYDLCLKDISKRLANSSLDISHLLSIYRCTQAILQINNNIEKRLTKNRDDFLKIMNECLAIFFLLEEQNCSVLNLASCDIYHFTDAFKLAAERCTAMPAELLSKELLENIIFSLGLIFKKIIPAALYGGAFQHNLSAQFSIPIVLHHIDKILEHIVNFERKQGEPAFSEVITTFEMHGCIYLEALLQNLAKLQDPQKNIIALKNFQRFLDKFFPENEALLNGLSCKTLLEKYLSWTTPILDAQTLSRGKNLSDFITEFDKVELVPLFDSNHLSSFIEIFDKIGRGYLSLDFIYAFLSISKRDLSKTIPKEIFYKVYHPEKTSLSQRLEFLRQKDDTSIATLFLDFYAAAESAFMSHFQYVEQAGAQKPVSSDTFIQPPSPETTSTITLIPATRDEMVTYEISAAGAHKYTAISTSPGKLLSKEDIQKILENGQNSTANEQTRYLRLEDFDYTSVDFDSLSKLTEKYHVFAKTLFFGIHAKYSAIPAAAPIPFVLKDYSEQQDEAQQTCPTSTLATQYFTTIEQLSASFSAPVTPVPFESDEYTMYTAGPLNLALPAITVFAGRKTKAHIPPSSEACVFIILTNTEYQELGDYRYNLLTLGYHLIVVNAPLGIDAHSAQLTTLFEKAEDAQRLTARRRVAMLLCYDFEFKTLIMMDDNISSVSSAIVSSESSWANILNSIIKYHVQSDGIISTIQTHTPIASYDTPSNRIGWKILLFKMDCVRALFSQEQSYFLFPCNLTASGEDAFVQLFMHISAQRSKNHLPGFSKLLLEQCYLVRSKTRSSLNACVKNGVVAQHIELQSHEESAAKTYFSEEQFESLQMAMLIFNKNISLNQDIRVKSNIARTEYDIAGSILKKRKHENYFSESFLFSLPPDIESFQEALDTIASSESLNLRAPQAACLQTIARTEDKSGKSLISILPTGTGKTRIEAYLAYAMSHANPRSHSIIIAPTRTLSEQVDADFYNEGCLIDKKYRERLIAVYSSNSGPAASLQSLLQNKNMQSDLSGYIFVFCLKSLHELLKIATSTDTAFHEQALMLLARLKMFIFDEEHITFSLEVSRLIKELQEAGKLPQLTHIFGFTATSLADPLYKKSSYHLKKSKTTITREIIFSYTAQQAQDAGFIRPITYEVAQRDTISNFLMEYSFTDRSPLLEHVGIIVCDSISQINRLTAELQEKLPALNVYDIHSAGRDLYKKLGDFSKQTNNAVALVVDMLKEGYNHPQVRYTVMLKNSSEADREQRAGRTRRKVSSGDRHCALFVDLTLTSEQAIKKIPAPNKNCIVLSRKRTQSEIDAEDSYLSHHQQHSPISFSYSSHSAFSGPKNPRL